MAFDFKFPDVGEGIAEGLLVKWRVKEGDMVKEDQVLAEVETDKAIVEVPSPKTGKVLKLHAQENQTIKVGQVIVSFDDGTGPTIITTETAPDAERAKAPTVVGAIAEELSFGTPSSPVRRSISSTTSQTQKSAAPVMPRIRQLAKELGVDLDTLEGSGPGGRITEEDVKRASTSKGTEKVSATSTASSPGMAAGLEKYGPVVKEPFQGARKSIAERLLKTTTSAPLVTHFDVADMDAVEKFRQKQKITYMPFFIKAVVSALKQYPQINAVLDEAASQIVYMKYYNIGIAVDTENGLMVPVIKDADKKSLDQLGADLKGISERARTRAISLEEMRGGSFTISNVGAVGGIFATPIMNYPQSAILAIGKIREVPVVRSGKIVIGKDAPLSLTFDHRLIDGADAGRFVNHIIEQLQHPEKL